MSERVKVTIYLDGYTAQRLRAYAAYKGIELGQVVALGLRATLADFVCHESEAERAMRAGVPEVLDGGGGGGGEPAAAAASPQLRPRLRVGT